jgi:hypothetical protein
VARLISRPGQLLALVALLSVSAGLLGAPDGVAAADPRLPAWRGGVSLYRSGTFTTQKSWLWCTAADVQIIRNISRQGHDHSTSGQRTYYNWMRGHNRYTLPQSAGVDPQGWTAGLRHFVDDRYRLVASTTFDEALRSAVTNLRLTNLPVAVGVSHGNHGWVLTGFTATADPLRTTSFKVTSVRVVGPLFGLQSKNGYDMPPNTKLTPAQFRRYFTPWHYAPMRMIWDGRFVSIQPIGAKAAPPEPKPAASKPTGTPTPTPNPSPSPTPALSPSPNPTPATNPASTISRSPIAVALAVSPGPDPPSTPDRAPTVPTIVAPIALLMITLAVIAALAGWQLPARGRRSRR